MYVYLFKPVTCEGIPCQRSNFCIFTLHMKNKELHTVVLLLGSNLGERTFFLAEAVSKLSQQLGSIEKHSAYYETKSWGIESQPDFLNQVVICRTTYSAAESLAVCLSIEKALGRDRKEKWGSRTIDIDIIYYDRDIIATSTLKVPHPFIQDRRFVLVPLCELLPDFIHPVFNFSNKELLEKCADTLQVNRLNA